MMAVEYFISGRYLRAKQKQALISLITFLSVAGVTVGVMALIVVIAVMAGFGAELKSQILNVDAHITLKCHPTFTDYRQATKAIDEMPGTESAVPFISTYALLAASGSNPAIIRGVDLTAAGRGIGYLDADLLLQHEENRQKDSSLRSGIILGKRLAGYLGALEGDSVQLISPRNTLLPTGIGLMPVTRPFQVVGIFESGMYEYDRNLAFISLSSAQSLLRMQDEVQGVEIRVKEIYQADSVREKLIEALGGYPYYATDWMQNDQYQNLFRALKLEKTVMFIILVLIVLVASFNIVSTLIMTVMQKRRDIAILRTMGATDRQIRRIFVLKGMAIGLVGTVLGSALGVILCSLLKRYKFIDLPSDVYLLSYLPVLLQPSDVIVISVAALIICYVATLYPAIQASRMNPVEAIRNE